MTDDDFLTLAAPAVAETKVRGSTFLAHAAPAGDEEVARAFLATVRKEHHAATHNCSAWRIHSGVWRANDDGEPSGSAGAPILSAIDAVGLLDCVVVVTRYYGGTKLGVGGLVRAYGEAAALALGSAPRLAAVRAVRLRIRYPYELTSSVMRVLERMETFEVEHGYDGSGAEGVVSFAVPVNTAEAVAAGIRDATGGTLAPEEVGRRLVHLPAPPGLS
jgi:uncharacterized YigZ family protein